MLPSINACMNFNASIVQTTHTHTHKWYAVVSDNFWVFIYINTYPFWFAWSERERERKGKKKAFRFWDRNLMVEFCLWLSLFHVRPRYRTGIRYIYIRLTFRSIDFHGFNLDFSEHTNYIWMYKINHNLISDWYIINSHIYTESTSMVG